MISIFDLSPTTANTVRRLVLEKLTRRSTPVRLGSVTPIIINPTIKDTETNHGGDKEFRLDKKKSSKSETVTEAQSLLHLIFGSDK
jgi:hypothetical protein